MMTSRSRPAAALASRAWASDPPTSAPGSTACTESRSASMVLNASSDAGSASRTTDHWVRPPGTAPAGFAETTPGVAGDGALYLGGAVASSAMTRVGSVRPLGKWAASVS